ncbi:glycosyltransferase family 87 protein [Bacillus sp. FJAT-29814]|uniref:glycosyltransferase family 87 protein n=1 Tax=Bacillus sp. FJAT-29814 TaxID=1729688 RepID=UPI000830C01D|nr:glycosyltransferase family 87 protein [Bacillus sp. FJAT-29814]
MGTKYKNITKVLVIYLIIIIVILRWLPVITALLNNGFLQEKTSISDYYYFHYSFENVWENKQPEWLYNCSKLQAEVKENYNTDLPPNACYLYPPHFAVFFSWLGLFSFNDAEYIWNLLLSLLYIIGLLLFIKLIFKEKNYKFIISLVVLLSLLHYPFVFDTLLSNSNRLIFFLVAVMIYLLYEREKDFFAGIPLGLAIVFKVTPAIILVFYLIKGKVKLAIGTFISILICTLIVISTIGWRTLWNFSTKDFWNFNKKLGHFGVPYDNSIQGIISTYVPDAPSNILFFIYFFIFFLLYIYLLQRSNHQKFEIGIIVISPLIFSPHLEVHHLILSMFPLIIIVHYLWRNYKFKGVFKFLIVILCTLSFLIFTFLDFGNSKGEYFVGLMLIFLSLILINKKQNLNSAKRIEYYYDLKTLKPKLRSTVLADKTINYNGYKS